jgi:drug/metabolite transporter (DMT)-like permease
MGILAVLLTITALVAVTVWFRPRARPFPIAFSTTAAGILLFVAGTMGYRLSRHDRFVAGTSWSDGVVWWEIYAGVTVLLVAAYFWRKALRSIP